MIKRIETYKTSSEYPMNRIVKSILTFVFAAFAFTTVFAREINIDSLRSVINNEIDDSRKISLYIEFGELLKNQKPPESALKLLDEGIHLATIKNDEFSKAKILKYKGHIHSTLYKYDYETALEYFHEAAKINKNLLGDDITLQLEIAKELAGLINSTAYLYWQWGKLFESLRYYDSAIAVSNMVWEKDSTDAVFIKLMGLQHNSKGAALWGLGQYEEAAKFYYKALHFYNKENLTKYLSLTHSNLALVYESWDQHELAIGYVKKAMDLGVQSGDASAYGYALSNMGRYMELEQDYDSALYYYKESTETYLTVNNYSSTALNMNRVGKIYLRKGDKRKSLESFHSALDYAETNKANYWIAFTNLNISEALLASGELAKAKKHGFKSLEVAKKEGYIEIEKDNLGNLSKIYEKEKNYLLAHQYFQSYTSMKDSLFNEDKFRQITLIREQYEAENKEKENYILRHEKLLQEQRLARSQTEIYGLIVISIILLSFAVYFIIVKNRIKEVNRQLTGKNAEITRQREASIKQAEALEKSNQIKNLMFSIVSHDLRGPIGKLEQLVTMLNKKIISEEDFKFILPKVATNISDVSNLTDNLLYWARSQMEGINVVPKYFDLHKTLEVKLSIFERAAEDKGINFTNDIPNGLNVYADSYMVELVIRNLVSNAIKFCSPGEHIRLTAKSQGNEVIVKVSDTGLGIPPEDLHRIFNDVDFTTLGTRNEKGAGLGLMICKHFINLNGGKIWVESTYRKGADFYFTLPLAREKTRHLSNPELLSVN